MKYCHMFWSGMQYARIEMQEFINENKEHITKVSTRNMLCLLDNGDTHYFMDRHKYKTWCLGRTYMMGGELYHSGDRYEEMEK